jgi:branched-chain amino acid aminotransferase
MPTVFLNGRFLERDEAMVSAFDAGLQHGVGLFETMSARVREGSADVPFLERHVERMVESARTLGLSDSLRRHALAEAVGQTAERAAAADGAAHLRLRLTVTGGDLNLLARGGAFGSGAAATNGEPGRRPDGHDPTVLIVAQPATQYPPEWFDRGGRVVVADLRVNPLDASQGHKTLAYWPRLRELQAAAAKRGDEALLFQVTNHLAGGAVSNAFLVKGGEMLTPIARGEEEDVAGAAGGGGGGAVMPSPVLPGVTRRFVIDWAGENGVRVVRRMLTIDDVLGADELFLTNSSWGVLPIVRVEREAIGDGVVGAVARRARAAWLEATGG